MLEGNYWLLHISAHIHTLNLVSIYASPVCLLLLFSVSCSRLSGWFCVSAALTGKSSQLRIRRHGTLQPMGSKIPQSWLFSHLGWNALNHPEFPYVNTRTHTHAYTLGAKASLDVEFGGNSRVRKHSQEGCWCVHSRHADFRKFKKHFYNNSNSRFKKNKTPSYTQKRHCFITRKTCSCTTGLVSGSWW